ASVIGNPVCEVCRFDLVLEFLLFSGVVNSERDNLVEVFLSRFLARNCKDSLLFGHSCHNWFRFRISYQLIEWSGEEIPVD
ncbi:hypothetical protein PENTCL1PPCAC_21121, partial [Pristionchus entomophagus]